VRRFDFGNNELLTPTLPMNLLGALASRRPVGSRKPELAGETPALPGTVPRFKGSKRESVRGNLSSFGEERKKTGIVRE
jgi:hypothetical protein